MKINGNLKLNDNRRSSLKSGYLGVIAFNNIEWNASCQVILIDKIQLENNEECNCEITIIVKDSIDFLKDKLFIGLEYELVDGERIVGNGNILKIN